MQHPDSETLSSYIDGELPSEEAAQIEAHLATCPECQREYAELKAVSSLVRNLRSYEPRNKVVIPDAGRPRPTGTVTNLSRYIRPLAVAAIVIIVAVAGLRVIEELNDTEPSGEDQQVALSPDEGDGTESMDQASESTAGAPELDQEVADQPPPMAAIPRREEPAAAFEPAQETPGIANAIQPSGTGAATVAPTESPGETGEGEDRTTGEVARMVIYVVLGVAIIAGAFWTLYRRIRRDTR